MLQLRISEALALHHAGKTEESVSELTSIWATTTWPADAVDSKRQVLLLLTNLSPDVEQRDWLRLFDELQQSLGSANNAGEDACPICLGALRSTNGDDGAAFQRVCISPCFHLTHQACWEATKAASDGGDVCCPVCRHPIVVSTAPTIVDNETQVAVPLRRGREMQDMREAFGQ